MEEKILVTKSAMPDFDKYCEKIKQLWDSHWLTNNGTLHQELTERLKDYLGVNNITLFTNGHLSLEFALQLMNFPENSEVITTPFTFISTTHAIARNNLIPVFCDINPDDFTIDVAKIENLITDKTVAIVPVHVYGNVCNVEKIEEIANRHHLKVIYDAAHAFGVKYKGKSIADFGDISMFSFHATKVFNTIEGGALAYNNSEYSSKLDSLKNFGLVGENVEYIGGNAKMNEFQAAMGICNLEELDINIAKRKKVVELYRNLLKETKGIKMCMDQKDVISNYAYFPIVLESDYKISRDELIKDLSEHNIFARKYFYPISNESVCYKKCVGKTPIAKSISERVLTIPLYPDLDEVMVRKICKIIKGE